MIKLKFDIAFRSDYHISAGYGHSKLVDSVLMRDTWGNPVIMGSHISGILRQGLYELLQSNLLKAERKCSQSRENDAESFCQGDDKCPICSIFGSPHEKKQWIFSTAVVKGIVANDSDKGSRIDDKSINCRNRIDYENNRSEEGKLFSSEMGNKGWRFQFEIQNPSKSEAALLQSAIICAASGMVSSIGSDKSRGSGECTLKLKEIEGILFDKRPAKPDELMELFYQYYLRGNKDYLRKYSIDIKKQAKKTADSDCRNLVLVMKLREPIIISQSSERGNSYDSLDRIPGYTVLGAFAKRASYNTTDGDYSDFSDIFCQDGASFSPLYPAEIKGDYIMPSLPVPNDFFGCKAEAFDNFTYKKKKDEHSFFKLSQIEKIEKTCHKEGCENGLKQLSGYINIDTLKTLAVKQTRDMHVKIDNEKGTSQKGMLFSYNAIERGQYFAGSIKLREGKFRAFQKLLDIEPGVVFTLYIGKASGRGYGKVDCVLIDMKDKNLWHGADISKRVDKSDNTINMYFISDAIIRDDWGRYISGIDSDYLSELLGVRVIVKHDYLRSGEISGFNTMSGLPREKDIAIKAGSVISFELEEKTDKNKELLMKSMKSIEKKGIGMRKAEGFGMIVFNHYMYKNIEADFRIRKLPDELSDKKIGNMGNDIFYESKLESEGIKAMGKEISKQVENKTLGACLVIGRYIAGKSNHMAKDRDVNRLIEDLKEYTQEWFNREGKESQKEKLNKIIAIISEYIDKLADAAPLQMQRGMEEIAKELIEISKGGDSI